MIVDEDTATGMLLTGIGHTDMKKNTNFLIVNDSASLNADGFVADCGVAR
jgi:vacuolar-type H+-ATPase subunit F/Vma7